ncbi:MAG: hypothetical protein ACQGVK_09930 [Myxococcota bacterium]
MSKNSATQGSDDSVIELVIGTYPIDAIASDGEHPYVLHNFLFGNTILFREDVSEEDTLRVVAEIQEEWSERRRGLGLEPPRFEVRRREEAA